MPPKPMTGIRTACAASYTSRNAIRILAVADDLCLVVGQVSEHVGEIGGLDAAECRQSLNHRGSRADVLQPSRIYHAALSLPGTRRWISVNPPAREALHHDPA